MAGVRRPRVRDRPYRPKIGRIRIIIFLLAATGAVQLATPHNVATKFVNPNYKRSGPMNPNAFTRQHFYNIMMKSQVKPDTYLSKEFINSFEEYQYQQAYKDFAKKFGVNISHDANISRLNQADMGNLSRGRDNNVTALDDKNSPNGKVNDTILPTNSSESEGWWKDCRIPITVITLGVIGFVALVILVVYWFKKQMHKTGKPENGSREKGNDDDELMSGSCPCPSPSPGQVPEEQWIRHSVINLRNPVNGTTEEAIYIQPQDNGMELMAKPESKTKPELVTQPEPVTKFESQTERKPIAKFESPPGAGRRFELHDVEEPHTKIELYEPKPAAKYGSPDELKPRTKFEFPIPQPGVTFELSEPKQGSKYELPKEPKPADKFEFPEPGSTVEFPEPRQTGGKYDFPIPTAEEVLALPELKPGEMLQIPKEPKPAERFEFPEPGATFQFPEPKQTGGKYDFPIPEPEAVLALPELKPGEMLQIPKEPKPAGMFEFPEPGASFQFPEPKQTGGKYDFPIPGPEAVLALPELKPGEMLEIPKEPKPAGMFEFPEPGASFQFPEPKQTGGKYDFPIPEPEAVLALPELKPGEMLQIPKEPKPTGMFEFPEPGATFEFPEPKPAGGKYDFPIPEPEAVLALPELKPGDMLEIPKEPDPGGRFEFPEPGGTFQFPEPKPGGKYDFPTPETGGTFELPALPEAEMKFQLPAKLGLPKKPAKDVEKKPEDLKMKAKGLLERRGSSAALTIDLTQNTLDNKLSLITPTEECAEEYLLSAANVLTRAKLKNALKNVQDLHSEFWDIPLNHPEKAEVFGCALKNRYETILPNERTRVKLETDSENPLDAYINANYIRGYNGEDKAYIATQGPLSNTVQDMYRMAWTEKSPIIVMITKLYEKNKVKCEPYIPAEINETQKYGDFEVTVLSNTRKDGYDVRQLLVRKNSDTRVIMHYWYDTWPDHKAPPNANTIVGLATEIEKLRIDLKNNACPELTDTFNIQFGPPIIHCSAGIGRTGCFIGICIGMNQLKAENKVDILGILCQMRCDRGGMIQTAEQYEFVHEALGVFSDTLPDTGGI